MKKKTKTEQRVIHAMRDLDRMAQEDFEAAGWNEPTPEHFLHGFKSIYTMTRIIAYGRKPGELQVHDALQKLVASGEVERSTASGMGGSLTLYILQV